MTMNVEWSNKEGLLGIFPIAEPIQDLVAASAKIGGTVKTLLEALNSLSAIENLIAAGLTNAISLVVRPIIEDVRNRIRDIRKTGAYVTTLGFRQNLLRGSVLVGDKRTDFTGLAGGLSGLKRELAFALSNERDPSWPGFGPTSFTTGIGVFVHGPDKTMIDRAMALFEKVFVSDDVKKNALGIRDFFVDQVEGGAERTFRDGFDSYRQANTANLTSDPKWGFMSLEALIGGLGDPLVAIESLLNGLLSLLVKLQIFHKFFELARAVLAEIVQVLQILQSFIDFLELLLTKFPIITLRFRPQPGGVRGIVESLDEWFDPALHPELKTVSANAYTLGIFILGGFPSAATVQAEEVVWDAIFG
jgi:hypothetical protein